MVTRAALDKSEGTVANWREIERSTTHLAARYGGQQMLREDRKLAEHERKRVLRPIETQRDRRVVRSRRRFDRGEIPGARIARRGIARGIYGEGDVARSRRSSILPRETGNQMQGEGSPIL